MYPFFEVMRMRPADADMSLAYVNVATVVRILPGSVGQIDNTAPNCFRPTSSELVFSDGSTMTVAGSPEALMATWRNYKDRQGQG